MYQGVYKHLLRRLSGRFGPDLASDAIQEALLKGLLRRNQLKDEGSLIPWLRTTAMREGFNYMRRSRNLVPNPELLELIDPNGGSADAIDLSLCLTAVMAKLPAKQRSVLHLMYWRGFSCAEIASILNTTEQAVYSLSARARRTLRQHLSPRSSRAAPR